ncbi:Integrator complex subunit 3 [Podila humilis]|nr:Integrator complex subunit 3 [Podila humilis]
MAAPPEAVQSLMFDYTYEEEDPVEKEMIVAHQQLIDSFQGRSNHEIHNFLQQEASASMARHTEIINGLLYGILTNKQEAPDYYKHMNFVSRDQLTLAGRQIRYFCIHPMFHRMHQTIKEQLVWILDQLTDLRFQGCDNLYMNLLKQIRGGDISPGNVQHAENMISLLNSHLQWVYTNPILIAYSCYTYLRILLDHSRYQSLRQQEVAYCAKLLRERFRECCEVGRDLIRALQDVAQIKEFEGIWKDLLFNPENLNPQLDSIQRIMALPSRDIYLGSRLTFDMERKLLFILKTINFGEHHKNTSWFFERYLAAPEADILFADVIRYICGVYHPTNAVLASAIVPRWALISTLLKYVRSNVTATNLKLALFYDWLFYDPQKDSIMNIEPAMLLMERSFTVMREPYLTSYFLEFLHFTVLNYHPPSKEFIQKHVGLAAQTLLEKQVIKKLGPMYTAYTDQQSVVREYLLALFPHQLAAEGVSNIQLGSTASMENLDEIHHMPGTESDGSDATDDLEIGSINKAFDPAGDHASGGDEEDVFLGSGHGKNAGKRTSRDTSRESSLEPMQIEESPTVAPSSKPLTNQLDDDVEETVEDIIMESATVESSIMSQPVAGVEPIIPNWNFPSPSAMSGGTVSSKDGGEETPTPGASLWIFGSSLQDFKKAYDIAPDAVDTGDLFRKIWDVYSDVGGANVEGADLASEIGHEICAYAQKAELSETYLTNTAEISSEVFDALISCLWRVMDRDGEDGARRVAQMFIRSELNVNIQVRYLGMWYLVGLIGWHTQSVGQDKLHLDKIMELYGGYLMDSAAQEQASAEMQSESEQDDTYINQTTIDMAQQFMLRDLRFLQDRQLGIFDITLPLILRHLPDLVPKDEQFLQLILSMTTPVKIYNLCLGLTRREYVVLSTPTIDPTTSSAPTKNKKSTNKGKSKAVSLQANSPSSTLKDVMTGDWEPKVTAKLIDTLGKTVNWPVFEQIGVWQLVQSELGGDSKATCRILRASWIPSLTTSANSEALTGLLNLTRTLVTAPPDLKFGKAIAHIAATPEEDISGDMIHFCATCVVHWASTYPDHLAALLLHLSDKSVPQDQLSEFSAMAADIDVDMEEVSGVASGNKTLRSSRSKSSATTIAKVKLNSKQRKQQGVMLQGLLRLLTKWWIDMEASSRSVLFNRVWTKQVQSQVKEAIMDTFEESFASWPKQWWPTNKKGSRRRDDGDDDDNNDDSSDDGSDAEGIADGDDSEVSDNEDEEKSKSEKPDEDEEEEDEKENEEQEYEIDDVEENERSTKNKRSTAKDKKRFGGAAGSLSSSASSSRRNSPKTEKSSSTFKKNASNGVLSSRFSTRKKTATATPALSVQRGPATRRSKAQTRKRKLSDDEDEDEEEEEHDDDEEEDEDNEDDDEDEADEDEDEDEDGVEGENGEDEDEQNDEDKDEEEHEDDEEEEDGTKTLKPMIYSQRKAAASANSKLMSKSGGNSTSSSSSATSSANSTPNPNTKGKASTSSGPSSRKRGKATRRILSDDESDS